MDPPLILCAGSEPRELARLERRLGALGYRVEVASSRAELLETAAARHPDLVLLAGDLAGADSASLAATVRRVRRTIQCPLLVEVGGAAEEETARGAGATGCLRRPVSRDDLLSALRTHLGNPKGRGPAAGLAPATRRLSTPPDFAAFKRALADKLSLPPARRELLAAVPVAGLYSLVESLGISATELARTVAEFASLPYAGDLRREELDPDVLPESFCRANSVAAVRREGELAFVFSNPFDWTLLGSLAHFHRSGRPSSHLIAEPAAVVGLLDDDAAASRVETIEARSLADILEELQKRYRSEETASAFQETSGPAEPLVLLVNRLIEIAHVMGASDIHIEPWEDSVVVRYRLDGELRIIHRFRPRSLIRPLVSRIKVMSGLDISERRLPQDGRIVVKEFVPGSVDFDLRVSTAPMNFGEKVVMRIVDKQKSVLPLDALGFSERHLRLYREEIRTPYGMALHVGPTGSGKSMTLYAALNELKSPAINIQTVEDPIEYTLPGINQMQTRAGIGLTFHRALRAYLRQDPDVILVGEIRDVETAEIAVEASLTGHLLLSTLHTNDAASTITRFIQMGVEPFMVSSSVVLVCAQRLIRRLCPHCKEPFEPTPEERRLAGLPPAGGAVLYRPKGCPSCNGIGYKGRIGAHEILVPEDGLRMAVNQKGITAEALKRLAVERCGMTTLYWDAMEKVRRGTSAMADVLAKVRRDEFDARPRWLLEELDVEPAKKELELASAE